ncbi:hypothetical protein ADUPG1_008001 [Aduncisulcus paluster]|uniref:Uncharacterized protein n=1 Tax=Aduncisulcus paluster TaxID=2918883 RepID=A0ABQ5KTH5_9EUKA|nr:hypothetical protein ADUPG1_008001 [Aduncisulcus paluster]
MIPLKSLRSTLKNREKYLKSLPSAEIEKIERTKKSIENVQKNIEARRLDRAIAEYIKQKEDNRKKYMKQTKSRLKSLPKDVSEKKKQQLVDSIKEEQMYIRNYPILEQFIPFQDPEKKDLVKQVLSKIKEIVSDKDYQYDVEHAVSELRKRKEIIQSSILKNSKKAPKTPRKTIYPTEIPKFSAYEIPSILEFVDSDGSIPNFKYGRLLHVDFITITPSSEDSSSYDTFIAQMLDKESKQSLSRRAIQKSVERKKVRIQNEKEQKIRQAELSIVKDVVLDGLEDVAEEKFERIPISKSKSKSHKKQSKEEEEEEEEPHAPSPEVEEREITQIQGHDAFDDIFEDVAEEKTADDCVVKLKGERLKLTDVDLDDDRDIDVFRKRRGLKTSDKFGKNWVVRKKRNFDRK